MQKWEYMVWSISDVAVHKASAPASDRNSYEGKALSIALAAAGEAGWEMTGTFSGTGYSGTLILKRPKG